MSDRSQLYVETFLSIIAMSEVPKGGKATGARSRDVPTVVGDGGEDGIIFPARDIRRDGVEGPRVRMERNGSQRSRHVPRYTCGTCQDLCCGLARELVTAAFSLGRIEMSRWVSEVILII